MSSTRLTIQIVVPRAAGRRSGNRVTAKRWRRLLRSMGHVVEIVDGYDGQDCDVLVAVHAHKTARSALRYVREVPDGRLVVALSGTDLYRDLATSVRGQQVLEVAHRIVLLQEHGKTLLERRLHKKCHVIHQSVVSPRTIPGKIRRWWQVALIGHLRPVKDPFLLPRAVSELPADSRIRVVHLGGALSERMRSRAEAEMARRPDRYRWLGSRPHWQVMRVLARSRLMVLTSHMEGGANVVGESITAGTPVLSTRISGSIGLLGADYPGFFGAGDAQELRRQLLEAERQGEFYDAISERCAALRSVFAPRRECREWERLLKGLSGDR